MKLKKEIEIIAGWIKASQRIVVLTGAGISAESGVPTFRGEDGIWKKFRPEELANFNAFIKNPALVQEWYDYRRKLVEKVKPNAGHYALTQLQQMKVSVTIITQNIDNLHQRAGSRDIIELHGNIFKNYCIECGKRFDDLELNVDSAIGIKRCECGGLIRPDVVWFGEMLPEIEYHKAVTETKKCDLFFSIGTSGVVYPAAQLPSIAKDHHAFLVEINPDYTEISFIMDIVIREKSGIILPQIIDTLA